MKTLFFIYLIFLTFSISFSQEAEDTKVEYLAIGETKTGLNTWVIDTAFIDQKDYVSLSGTDGTHLTSLPYNNYFTDLFGTEVYGSRMYFLFKYDEESFIFVTPETKFDIGSQPWTKLEYINFYSTNPSKIIELNDSLAQDWIIGITSEGFEKTNKLE